MTTLPQMGLVLPTRGAPGSGLWADAIDAMMALIDAHTHQTGSGALIRPAAIGINGDLTFAGNGATNLGKAAFTAVAALAAGSKTLFVSSSDNELYWRTNGGTNVKLTSGSTLNVAGFVGGIGGDYSSVSAALNYDDATKAYTHKQGGGTTWARIYSGELRILETGTSESFYTGIAANAALASSYTLTLPAALPGSTQLVQMSSAGQMSFSNTVANLITASAGVTCAADQHVTVSGTGAYKHGDMERTISPLGYRFTANASYGTGPVQVASSGATTLHASIPMKVGERIKGISLARFGNGSADITSIDVYRTTAAGVDTNIGTTSETNPSAAWADTTINLTDTTIATGDSISLIVVINASGIAMGNIRITYDHP
jgi:hypothetical protein